MNEKRFKGYFATNEKWFLFDNETEEYMDMEDCKDKLNEQQSTINELKAQLKQKEQEERLYANEILKLNKEAKQVLEFKSLGGDY